VVEPQQGASHWDAVYTNKDVTSVSWHQDTPTTSLRLIGPPRGTLVDVGAGASNLADHLLAAGWDHLTLLDVSTAGLDLTRGRLGGDATRATFVVSDLLAWQPTASYDVWHDRAVLHFLTEPDQRAAYVALAARTVTTGGRLVIGGFAPNGPTHCSGLPTARRSAEQIADEFVSNFTIVKVESETHHTPAGAEQEFVWAVLRRH